MRRKDKEEKEGLSLLRKGGKRGGGEKSKDFGELGDDGGVREERHVGGREEKCIR